VGEGADVGVHGLTFVARSTAGYFGDAKVSRLLFVLVEHLMQPLAYCSQVFFKHSCTMRIRPFGVRCIFGRIFGVFGRNRPFLIEFRMF
jgi:hypothetical protein